MQKPTNRILSALLVLVMILSMLPATVFATSETADPFKGWSLTLGENVGVNFYLEKEAAAYTVSATVAGKEAAYQATETDDDYIVTVAVAAAQMTDTIVLTVNNGDAVVHTGEYSVRQYAEKILTGEYDAEVKDMVVQMLNYGAAAQTYFNYNADADKLANKGYELETAASVSTEVPEFVAEDQLAGIDLYGVSLLFQSKTAVRFYFTVSGDIADYTFSQGTPVEKGDMYYVEIGNINPQDLDNPITIEVSKGEDKLTASYSPLTYIVRKYNSSDSSDSLKALVQAMYGYHLEALDYQEYLKIVQIESLSAATQWGSNGVDYNGDGTISNIYATANANDAAYNNDWSVEYSPVAADVIKLVRGGETVNVGIPGSGTLVKFNESDFALKLAAWTISGSKLPLADQDYLIVEGRFSHEASGTTIQIAKTYIYNNNGTIEFSATEPVLPVTIDAGIMSKHASNGWASNGVYGVMAENAAPYDGWSVEYTPVAAENLKLIRGGETYNIGIPGRGTLVKYSATEYFLKMEWNVGDYAPMQDGDVLIVEGGFVNEASKVTLNISKTYIYANGSDVEFSTEMPVLPTTIDAGIMSKHASNGWASNGVYGVMAENAAPYDGWNVEYTPVAAENLKLIRGGETYNIGIPGRGTLVKYSATEYFLKMEWNVGDYAPMQDGDVLIVEGGFVNEASKVTLNISKTYIYANGSDVEFSTEMPVLPSTVEGGVMQSHPNGMSGNGIYFKLDANDAPYDSWNYEYVQTKTSGIKLIRNGVTKDIGIVGRPLIVKYSDTEYYLKLEGWTVGSYGLNDQTDPITTDDVLIIEGGFTHEASKVTLNISKSYIYYDGAAWICAANLPVEVDCGVMSEHADGTPDEIYFSMADNSVPGDEEIAYPYAGTVQLVTGSNVETVNAAIYKIADDQYYLELDGAELADQSYLIVEGAFSNADNGYTMNITRTYVLNDGGSLVFSTTEPVFETEFALTGLTNHSNGWTADGIYITHNAHEATVNSDWSVEYKPVSADVIKLIRNGVTTSIGQPASGTLVAYSNTEMFLKTAAWTIQGGVLPFVDGDQIIIEGKFKHEASGNILVVEKTVICVNGTSLIFNPIFAGTMTNHPNSVSGEGVYATMAENAAPYDGWSIEYTPVTADAYYVIRGGEQINIGIPGRGTLVKYSATEYFLKINAWCTDSFAYTTDDIIVIDGFWKNDTNGIVMKMDKTYLYHDGSAWTFATKLPSTVFAGVMQTHGKGMEGNGIYFSMDANDAPYNSDWSLEYTQTSVDNIKLIRDDQTISVGIAGRPLIVKISDVQYYLKLEGWTIGDYAPVTTDDVIIIEGNFEYAADNVTLNISKSYVYYDGTSWVCSDTAPVQKNIVDMVELGSHSNGWTSGGFYFTAAANTAPYDGTWALRYKPVSADAIKLIHDGNTTNVGNTGGETIVKYSETEYYVEGWTVGMGNVVAGDQMIIDGQFYNAANDVYIDVEKTTITFNGNGSITVISERSKYINAGAMSAYTSNWFGDGIYFALNSNAAPAEAEWNVRYVPKNAANIKLIRNGETVNIANTGAETIVKIADGWYWLSLESWWWESYAPIQDGDILIVEGEFANASNGYTLNIDKTYITFISKESDDVVFSAAADTEFGEVLLPNTNDTLTIGVWNGSHHNFNDARMAELQAAGITKIMGINPKYTGAEYGGITGMLDRAEKYGISVIVDLRDWDGTTVPEYVDHPALIGFLMYDEPSTKNFDTLADLKTKFDAVMPENLIFYVNLFPECAADSSLFGQSLNFFTDYDKYYVTKFLDTLDIEVLSWDNYSLLTDSSKTQTGIRTDYFHNFEVMASKDVPMWYTMLSAGHGTSYYYNTPTEQELRWQMAVAMTYGVQNIDHYVYTSHESDYSCMLDYNTETVTDLYYDIKDVNNEYLAWDNIFMAYDWVGVGTYSANSNNSMLSQLENSLNLSDYGVSVSASENLLVGVFDYNGDKAYMVTNAGSAGSTTVGDGKNFAMADTTVTLTLADADYKCVAIIDNGEISYVAVNADNTVTLNVQAYEGVFVIPVLN